MVSSNPFLKLSSIALLLTASIASPVATTIDTSLSGGILPDGYTMGNLTVTGTVGNIANVTIEGRDIDHVLEILKAQHPEFKLETNITSASTSSDHLPALKSRNKSDLNCCPIINRTFSWAHHDLIAKSIQRLSAMHGSRCGVGPISCVRLDYQLHPGHPDVDGSAVVLCNDNHYAIEPDCSYMASYAQDISNRCAKPAEIENGFPWTGQVVCGQEFDTDHYNIIIATSPTFGSSWNPWP